MEPAIELAEAARRLFAADGLTTGIFYRAALPPYPATVRAGSNDLTAIEAGFAL
jgi:hypothetical protein